MGGLNMQNRRDWLRTAGRRLSLQLIILGLVGMAAGGMSLSAVAQDDPSLTEKARQGFAISPVPKRQLNLESADRQMVGLGSYIVNSTGDCSGCHSFPQYLPQGNQAGSNPQAGDPYEGTPSSQSVDGLLQANFNTSHYMGGGQCFGPFMARNLTPDENGLPEGLTESGFITAMRTGEDIHCEKDPSDPICALGPDTPVLQVMPWPTYHSMTDTDLKAIYAYLKALPATTACNTVADGCPGFSGAAAKLSTYAYRNTEDCPNPAPPQ
jgi:hypothetical protein